MITDDAVTENGVAPPSRISAKEAFAKANAPVAPVESAPVSKPAKAAEPESATPSKSGVPESLLTGKKTFPVVEPPAAVDPWDAEPPKTLSKEGTIHFLKQGKAAKEKITFLNNELAAARQELESAKKNGAPTKEATEEVANLREQLNQMTQDFERVAYERSPKFQRAYSAKEKALIEGTGTKLKGVVGEDVIKTIFRAPDALRFDLMANTELSDIQRSYLNSALVQYDVLQAEKEAELGTASESLRRDEAEYVAAQKAQEEHRRVEERQVFDEVAKRLMETFEPFQKTGDPVWDAKVDERISHALAFYEGDGDVAKLSEVSLYAVGGKVIHEMFHELQSRYDAVVQENARLKSASPSAPSGGSNGRSSPAANPNQPFGMAARDAFNRAQTSAQ